MAKKNLKTEGALINFELIYFEFFKSRHASVRDFFKENYPEYFNKSGGLNGNIAQATKGWAVRRDLEKKELLEKARDEVALQDYENTKQSLEKVKNTLIETMLILSNTLSSLKYEDSQYGFVFNKNDIVFIEKAVNILRPYVGDANSINTINNNISIDNNDFEDELLKLKGF